MTCTKRMVELGLDVGAVFKEPGGFEHEVALVQAARLGDHAVVAGVELGELRLAPRTLALSGPRGLLLRRGRPVAKALRRDALELQEVDPPQEPREEPGRIAPDLMAAKRQIVDAVEQDREAIGGCDGREERVEARLRRVLPQDPLGDLAVGADPELLVRVSEERLNALAQPRSACARAAGEEDVLGADAVFDQ